MEKRYQVFISSTYQDLQEEREAVLRGILELDQFPVGMEVFPAADPQPLQLIRPIIEASDYYVLVIAGAYGSTDDAGISFTEREYDLAVELGKPVIAFLHANPDEIPSGKCALAPSARKKLAAFRSRVEKGHTRKHWTNKEELRTAVILALGHAIRTIPATGWIRADRIDKTDLLTRIDELRDEIDRLRAENERLKAYTSGGPINGIEDENAEVTVPVRLVNLETMGSDHVPYRDFPTKWGSLFAQVQEELLSGMPAEHAIHKIGAWIHRQIDGTELIAEMRKDADGIREPRLQINPRFFSVMRIQFMAWNAIEVTKQSFREIWTLTPYYRRRVLTNLARLNTDFDAPRE